MLLTILFLIFANYTITNVTNYTITNVTTILLLMLITIILQMLLTILLLGDSSDGGILRLYFLPKMICNS